MNRPFFSLSSTLALGALLCSAAPVRARAADDPQSPVPATAPAPADADAQTADDDDHAAIRLAEPDFTIVNLPTTLPLPKFKGDFHLTHRFNGNLRAIFGDNASNLFGLDQGAAISFEYRFGVTKHLEAIASRTNIGKAIQFAGKYDAWHQTASHPVAISGLVAVEGENNFKTQYSPTLGAVVSRTISDRAALYATPFWSHTSGAGGGVEHDTFVLGVGGRARVLDTVYLVAEVSPRLAGYAAGDPEFAFGIEKRLGGHVFQLTFANTQATSFRQIAAGGFRQSLYFGFNLARKFF